MNATQALDSATITVPAAVGNLPGQLKMLMAGSVFYCKSATLPFLMQFDSGTQFPFDAGFEFPADNFSSQTFFNPNPYPITITYYVGGKGVSFVGTSDVKNASTYMFGNLGLKANGTYNGQSISITNWGGFNVIGISNTQTITVAGLNNGHRRKQVVFTVATGSSPIMVADSNGNFFCIVTSSSPITFESDATLQISTSAAGGAIFAIGEIYYAQ